MDGTDIRPWYYAGSPDIEFGIRLDAGYLAKYSASEVQQAGSKIVYAAE